MSERGTRGRKIVVSKKKKQAFLKKEEKNSTCAVASIGSIFKIVPFCKKQKCSMSQTPRMFNALRQFVVRKRGGVFDPKVILAFF